MMAKGVLVRLGGPARGYAVTLDLIQYRDISKPGCAELFHVHHESPQLLLVKMVSVSLIIARRDGGGELCQR